jgi:ABC-type multidrug transport system permease subunit
MKIEESDSVKAARDRMDQNRDGKINMADLEATGIRNTIIEFFGIILWVSLAIGLLTAVWQLVTLKILTAVMTFVTTIVSVGVGFVVLDIRDRLIGRQ